MELTDTHCHLQFSRAFAEPEKVADEAFDEGVSRLICVGTTLEDSQKAVGLAQSQEGIWATVGAHPHGAEEFFKNKNQADELKKLLSGPKVVAVGEVGLDYYRLNSSAKSQRSALRAQIEAGLNSGLPFVFHVRDGWDDFWEIFDSYSGIKGVIHSFSAHPDRLEQVLNRELYVGLNGIMTFIKDKQQLAAAKLVPLDRLLLETDAPFLAPAPLRGSTCRPKHVKLVAEFLAELRAEPIEKLASATTQNAKKLFGLS